MPYIEPLRWPTNSQLPYTAGAVSYTHLDVYKRQGLRKARVTDLFEARLIFEPDTAALACRRASDEEINEIIALGKAVEQAILSLSLIHI